MARDSSVAGLGVSLGASVIVRAACLIEEITRSDPLPPSVH